MNSKIFEVSMLAIAVAFTAFFVAVVVPPLIENPDVIAAFAAGFVNPYAAGYSTDTILCWFVLLFLVIYERRSLAIKYGWVCLVFGVVPGVAVGFALYLLMRSKQLNARA